MKINLTKTTFCLGITPGCLSLVGIFILISSGLFAQDKTGYSGFNIKRNNQETKISSTGLEFTVRFLEPSSVPATSDQGTWKMTSESTAGKNLFGINGQLHSVSWSANTGQIDCEVWTSEKNDLLAFRQTFTNKTRKSLKLNGLYPVFIDGKDSFKFGNIHDWRILEQFRHKNDLPKSEIPGAGSLVSCDPFFVINNKMGNGNNLLIGYQTFSLHLADINISFTPDLQLDNIQAKCNFEGVEVPPDGSRTSQWVILSQGPDPNILIENYTNRIRAFYNEAEPLKNAPTVYCSWYYHADNYNQEIFESDIAQFKKERLPFDVFLIDECWDVNDWGDFEANSSFPKGMKWAAGEIKSAGYTAGIWCAPFLVDGESDLSKNHPSWLLRNTKGKLCTFNMNNRDHYILDLTYPGVCDYLEEQFRKISREWGYSYFKFDFMRSVFIDTDQQFFDNTATSLEAYRRGLEAIRRGTGKDAYISVCGGHYGASYGIANTQRSGSDVKSLWDEKELPKYRQNILRTWMADLWHVDPDAMMVRRQKKALESDKRNLTTGLFSDDEAFTNTVNQFIGGNLITFTEDFARIESDRKMLYRHVIPSVNSASRPLDPFNITCPGMMVTNIIPVCEKLDSWNILTIVNWNDETKDYQIILDKKLTGNLKGDRFLVYDFQSGTIVDYLSEMETLNVNGVKGHQSKLLKIVPWDGKNPMFLGTDLNFSCGGLEISVLENNNDEIRGVLDTDWFVPVKLTFVIPGVDGYKTKMVETLPGQKHFFISY